MSELVSLIMGHAVSDWALQSDWMAKHKSPKFNLDYAPWYYVLGSHSLINGAVVALITGNAWIGLAEAVLHFGIDLSKCLGKINIHQDQELHILCKVLWWIL